MSGAARRLRVAHLTTTDLTLRYLLLGQLRRLAAEGWEVTGISAPGPNAAVLEAEGIRHLPWRNATRSWNPVADARALAELVSLLRRERFDLVHTHNPKPGVLGRVGARLAGVPLVVNTVHGLYATPEDRLRKRAAVLGLEWLAGRCSDLELYQSEEDLRWAARLRLARRDRSHLLGNGTDTGRFDPAQVPPERAAALRRELGLPADALWWGRWAGWWPRRATASCSRPPARSTRPTRGSGSWPSAPPTWRRPTPSARPSWNGRPRTCSSPAGATTSATCWP
jgi:hypothetical protein